MRFQKRMAVLGLLLIALASQLQKSASTDVPANSMDDKDKVATSNTGLSEITGKQKDNMIKSGIQSSLGTASMLLFLAPLPPPMGAVLGTVAALFLAAYNIYEASKVTQYSDSTLKLMARMQKIENRVVTSSERVINQLDYLITGQGLISNMRVRLQTIEENYNENINSILNAANRSKKRKTLIKRLTDPFGDFHQSLQSFTSEFIRTSNTPLEDSFPENSFFKAVLQNNKQKAEEDHNCGLQSDQVKLFKSYYYITMVLTHGYRMVVAGHMALYHDYLNSDKSANPRMQRSIQKMWDETMEVIQSYVDQMYPIINDTKTALKESSRDIRPCDPTEPKLNDTYVRFPNFAKLQLVSRKYDIESSKNYLGAHEHVVLISSGCELFDFDESVLSYNGDSKSCKELNADGQISLYTDPQNKERKYSYLTRSSVSLLTGDDLEIIGIYGNPNQKQSHKISFKNRLCSLRACPFFDEGGQIKFSTKAVHAEDGFVVTGIRWVIVNDIVHMQLQVGKFENVITVDSETVHWQNISNKNDDTDIVRLDENKRSFILDDSILNVGSYVTGVQLTLVDGKLTLTVTGMGADDLASPWLIPKKSTALRSHSSPMKELKLDDADIPERAPKNQMNGVVGKPGEFYVKFQHSGLEADLSQTTIPYLDIQPVVTQPPAPIGGIGIYFKRIEGFGGFIGLKLLSPSLDEVVVPDNFKKQGEDLRELLKKIKANTKSLETGAS